MFQIKWCNLRGNVWCSTEENYVRMSVTFIHLQCVTKKYVYIPHTVLYVLLIFQIINHCLIMQKFDPGSISSQVFILFWLTSVSKRSHSYHETWLSETPTTLSWLYYYSPFRYDLIVNAILLDTSNHLDCGFNYHHISYLPAKNNFHAALLTYIIP